MTEAGNRSDRVWRFIASPAVPIAILVLPLIYASVRLLTHEGSLCPWGDTALLELAVRDVWHGDTLLGPYSRFKWRHPGPLLFYWLAVPHRFFGGQTVALFVGSLLTAATSAIVTAIVVHRRAGLVGTWWMCALLSAFFWTMGPEVLRVPWNPWVTILPLVCLVVLAWDAASGHEWAYPWAVGVGSFVVQSHVGHVVVATVILSLAGMLLTVRCVRRRRAGRLFGPAGASALVFFVLWAPPLWQELQSGAGNLTEIANFVQTSRPDHTVTKGLTVVIHYLGALPGQFVAWSPGQILVASPPLWSGILTTVALGVALAVSAWKRTTDVLFLVALVVAFLASGVYSVAMTIGPLEDHLVLWNAGGSVLVWFALGAAIHARKAPAGHALPRLSSMTAVAVLIVFTVINIHAVKLSGQPEPWGRFARRRVPALASALVRSLPPPGGGVVLVRLGDMEQWPVAAGVIVLLERAGHTTRVETDVAWMFGAHRVQTAAERRIAAVTLVAAAGAAPLRARGLTEVAGDGVTCAFVDVVAVARAAPR